MRMLPKRDGFTLIELLITLILVGILATMGISMFWRAKDRGLEASLQTDLKTAAIQQEMYFATHRGYAATMATLSGFDPSPGVSIAFTYAQANGWAGVATHSSLANTRCGILVGAAPVGSADPANATGIVMCTNQ